MLNFLYTAVSWVLLRWHQLFTAIGIDPTSGLNWALSIVFLTITARVLLFRFFIKQVHYQRRMQEMQPKLNAIKEKYKDDRQAQQQAMMKLQQDEGFNPLTGCLPIFLQIPIFISLFHVLRHLANSVGIADRVVNGLPVTQAQLSKLTLYGFTEAESISAAKATLWGAPLAASFRDSAATIHALGGNVVSTRLVILPLLLISAGATFATQLLVRSNATVAPVGTAATVQRLMLYLFPLGVLASGLVLNFPLGVLLYWFASNLWTLGQQAYVIRYHPQPVAAAAPDTGELGRSLAPKPGQKPVYDRKPATTRPANPAKDGPTKPVDGVDGVDSGDASDGTDVATPPPSRPPRPGQRPSRSGGSRPAGKRPSQAKKRR